MTTGAIFGGFRITFVNVHKINQIRRKNGWKSFRFAFHLQNLSVTKILQSRRILNSGGHFVDILGSNNRVRSKLGGPPILIQFQLSL